MFSFANLLKLGDEASKNALVNSKVPADHISEPHSLHPLAASDYENASNATERLSAIIKIDLTRNIFGNTSLHLEESPEALESLCKYLTPKELDLKNNEGNTALHQRSERMDNSANILIKYGANPFIKGSDGSTAFQTIYLTHKYYKLNPDFPLKVEVRNPAQQEVASNIKNTARAHSKFIKESLSIIVNNVFNGHVYDGCGSSDMKLINAFAKVNPGAINDHPLGFDQDADESGQKLLEASGKASVENDGDL